MSLPNSDDDLLLIRCPSCGQRFKVGDDLRGRTVECGGCEHRFRINDEVIARGKKFYPGERKNPGLERFHRVPLAEASAMRAAPASPAPRYAEAPDPVGFEPTPPQRIVAGMFGVAGMVFMALLLIFGASRGGMLDGMITQNRLLMAGFAGFLGVVLLVYANPRGRIKALAYGLLMAMGLVSLPFFFTTGSVPLAAEEREPVPSETGNSSGIRTEPQADETSGDRISQLRNLIGTRPLEEEIARLAREGSAKRAVGLWLRDLRGQNRFLIRDYILRTTGADQQSHFYPREGGDILMVITGIAHSLDEVAEIASVLGTLESVHPEISVVEIRVNNETFREGPIEKLNDRKDPAFYDLNKRELESIDLERVSKAIKRLAGAEPLVYRSDVTSKLIKLLEAPWVDFKGDVCTALSVWSEKPGLAGEAALKEAKELLARKVMVPEEMIALIVKEKNPGVVPVVDELWNGDPMKWERLYGDVGSAAEATLIRHFPETKGMLRQSAVRVLGRVGGADSLPVLESAIAGADSEMKVLIEKSSAAIRGRTGG